MTIFNIPTWTIDGLLDDDYPLDDCAHEIHDTLPDQTDEQTDPTSPNSEGSTVTGDNESRGSSRSGRTAVEGTRDESEWMLSGQTKKIRRRTFEPIVRLFFVRSIPTHIHTSTDFNRRNSN